MLDSKWGPHDIDRFASNLNNKCDRFNSKYWVPGTEAVDAFNQSWSNDLNWLVPPPAAILLTVKKVISDKAQSTLVIPKWKSGPFWSELVDRDSVYRSFVADACILPRSGIIVEGRGNNGIFAEVPLSFDMIALKLRF